MARIWIYWECIQGCTNGLSPTKGTKTLAIFADDISRTKDNARKRIPGKNIIEKKMYPRALIGLIGVMLTLLNECHQIGMKYKDITLNRL